MRRSRPTQRSVRPLVRDRRADAGSQGLHPEVARQVRDARVRCGSDGDRGGAINAAVLSTAIRLEAGRLLTRYRLAWPTLRARTRPRSTRRRGRSWRRSTASRRTRRTRSAWRGPRGIPRWARSCRIRSCRRCADHRCGIADLADPPASSGRPQSAARASQEPRNSGEDHEGALVDRLTCADSNSSSAPASSELDRARRSPRCLLSVHRPSCNWRFIVALRRVAGRAAEPLEPVVITWGA